MAEFVIDRSIHDELRALAQRIADQHGIVVTHISFEWTDVSTPGESRHLVMSSSIRSNQSH